MSAINFDEGFRHAVGLLTGEYRTPTGQVQPGENLGYTQQYTDNGWFKDLEIRTPDDVAVLKAGDHQAIFRKGPLIAVILTTDSRNPTLENTHVSTLYNDTKIRPNHYGMTLADFLTDPNQLGAKTTLKENNCWGSTPVERDKSRAMQFEASLGHDLTLR